MSAAAAATRRGSDRLTLLGFGLALLLGAVGISHWQGQEAEEDALLVARSEEGE